MCSRGTVGPKVPRALSQEKKNHLSVPGGPTVFFGSGPIGSSVHFRINGRVGGVRVRTAVSLPSFV